MKFVLATTILAFGIVGCTTNTPTSDTPAESDTTAATELSAPAMDVTLELLSVKDVPAQLAARKGKVVILDMWAIW